VIVLAGALIVGLFIGLVGIGGVFLPPLLVASGSTLETAIGTSLFTFAISGIVATVIYASRGGVDWRGAIITSMGSIVGGLLGARLSAHLPELVVMVCFTAFLFFAGISALFTRRAENGEPSPARPLSVWLLLACGLLVGTGSGLTGVGGPAILVPLLLLLRVPVSVAVGISQPNQIAASAAGAFGHLLYGQVNVQLALLLSLITGCGVAAGALLHSRFNTSALRKLVAASVIVLGLWLSGQIALHVRGS
jgi:uncharacterized membrane protein YfcA